MFLLYYDDVDGDDIAYTDIPAASNWVRNCDGWLVYFKYSSYKHLDHLCSASSRGLKAIYYLYFKWSAVINN